MSAVATPTATSTTPRTTSGARHLNEQPKAAAVRYEDLAPSIRKHPKYDEMVLLTVPDGSAPLRAPDGAFYVLPRGVDNAYINRALNHLVSIDSHAKRLLEFKQMYTDASPPHFLDFKRFGTPSGPKGYGPIEPIEYHSEAAGKVVRASPFEAAGNFFYGFVGSAAGLTNDELIIAAWWTQQGRSRVEKYIRRFLQDEPEDVPHVNFGIAEAAKYVQFESPVATTIPMPRRH